MKKILFAMLGILMFSCNKDEVLDTPDQNPNNGRSLYAQKHTPKTKAVELKDKRWEVGSTIKIKFLNGTASKKESVKNLSVEWMEYANINFQFLEDGSSEVADVRIGFAYNGDKKTWSYVGTDASNVPKSQPTMNFGNLSTLPSKAKHDVYMQFGHVLGLVNEHQGVNSPLVLNEDLIYDYYLEEKEDENWTAKDVTDFFFMPYKSSETNYTEYDPKSIMVWPMEEDLILSGTVPKRNTELSDIDKKFIGEMYPFLVGDATILEISTTSEIQMNFEQILKSPKEGGIISGDVKIDFGDGTNYMGKSEDAPIKTYTAGNYTIKINAEKLCLNFYWGKNAEGLKGVKLNGTTQYSYINFYTKTLETLEIDEANPPLLLQKEFDFTFSESKLTSVPENLFEKATQARKFSATFKMCKGLISVPENLFKYNIEVVSFSECFFITRLMAIPENLFKYNTKVTDFSQTFAGSCCFLSIPENLFKYNTMVKRFHGTFSGSAINSIPENIFMYNAEVELFWSVFNACQNLTAIPENLFKYNTKANNFVEAFSICFSLTGNAPKLWETHPSNGPQRCFSGSTGLSNYASIPDNWK